MDSSKKSHTGSGVLHVNVRLHKHGSKFVGAFPDFSRPIPIGFYSINEAREFEDNASNVAYLHLPHTSALPLDLNAGIEKVRRKIGDPEYHDIGQVCQYISKHPELLRKSSSGRMELSTDFVTLRGVLRQIMCTPYDRNSSYRLKASQLNGSIYISKVETEEQRIERIQMPTDRLNMCSWGFKFEQYCTTSNPSIEPDTSQPVIESEEFACVFRSKLNGIRLLYGAEMDCIRSPVQVNLSDPKQLSAAEFVELKTSTNMIKPQQRRSFDNFKSPKWWSQSFLVGIRTIIAGLRDAQGLAHTIQEYDVGELHRNKPWSAAAMATFLLSFLHELKRLMDHLNDPNMVVILDYKADKQKVIYTLIPGETVLPDWYCQMMQGNAHI